ncbi:AraC family transcriptional regulator [Bacillus cereus]|uniref:AraC family transcriptional regulator n=1 Tax=Bacillus cereus TaxID=1396 RepID=A0A2B2GMY3_BACCE|nr:MULTISPECIES: LacI family DNA-binding transcriptional regulator [Bacillus cereus group]MDR4984568.1 LacI family DNA-binding transcriptional regulator [Bacillus cereus]MEA1010998.1 LacI family DNA-binding transcriptional regulator [Bacillus cereus]PES98086.1 AraC family transcriptional regulator [Bacillus cereus]PFP82520.1 AraC family transcriptional regulator [Bacillus cereus]PGT20438.1 AraC family transcriptional regulator [Bacillus cereus]
MVTLNEIAKKAQISKTTVSRVLNEDQTLSVTEETRKKILQAAEELDYIPKKQRNIEKKITNPKQYGKIGLLMYLSQESEFDDPYFLAIRNGIEKRMIELGIELSKVLRPPFNKKDLEGLDGLIVVGVIGQEEVENQVKQVQHLVFVDVSPDEQLYDSVVIDSEKATEKVIQYLLDLGHKKIGYIGGQSYTIGGLSGKLEIHDVRKRTYEKMLTEQGLYNPKYTYIGKWTTKDGLTLMEEAIHSGNLPTAFFIGSDPMAIGALKALTDSGLKVPDDIAIFGFDGIELCEFVTPPLSTVKVHTEEMGKVAVNLLVERIDGRTLPLKVVVPTSLIVRKSCGGEGI